MKKYTECTIQPASGGFGEYDVTRGDTWDDETALFDAIIANEHDGIAELGVDDLPEGIEDIRGRIHNEPSRVFASLRHFDLEYEAPTYFGIDEWQE